MNLKLIFFFLCVLDFVRCYSEPNALCIDACSGSMTFSEACLLERRNVVAIDFDAKQLDGAIARLAKAQQAVNREHAFLARGEYKQMVQYHSWRKFKDVRHFPIQKTKKTGEQTIEESLAVQSSSSSSSSSAQTSEVNQEGFVDQTQMDTEIQQVAVAAMVASTVDDTLGNSQVCSISYLLTQC